jgi:hypothetical protein
MQVIVTALVTARFAVPRSIVGFEAAVVDLAAGV